MITVNLRGGLGNQMFQYACARVLSIKNQDGLKLDTAWLNLANKVGDVHRPFSLQHFNIQGTIAQSGALYGLYTKLRRKLTNESWHITFEPHILSLQGDVHLDGYFQSPKYFEDIRPTLLREFVLKDKSEAVANVEKMLHKSESVAVHIRRGDYAENPKVLKEFGVCSLTYYEKALAFMNQKLPEARYFVFSDDIAWVKENLAFGKNVVFVSDPSFSDADELYLMSQAKHNIIANSTFSWWAAWLNNNEDQTVIAPNPWFETTPYDKNLIPKEWIQIVKN